MRVLFLRLILHSRGQSHLELIIKRKRATFQSSWADPRWRHKSSRQSSLTARASRKWWRRSEERATRRIEDTKMASTAAPNSRWLDESGRHWRKSREKAKTSKGRLTLKSTASEHAPSSGSGDPFSIRPEEMDQDPRARQKTGGSSWVIGASKCHQETVKIPASPRSILIELRNLLASTWRLQLFGTGPFTNIKEQDCTSYPLAPAGPRKRLIAWWTCASSLIWDSSQLQIALY